jgi:hypothetical protein
MSTGSTSTQVADDLVELELVSGLVELERLRRIAVFERRDGPNRHGTRRPPHS